jgi:hypothetical protein
MSSAISNANCAIVGTLFKAGIAETVSTVSDNDCNGTVLAVSDTGCYGSVPGAASDEAEADSDEDMKTASSDGTTAATDGASGDPPHGLATMKKL